MQKSLSKVLLSFASDVGLRILVQPAIPFPHLLCIALGQKPIALPSFSVQFAKYELVVYRTVLPQDDHHGFYYEAMASVHHKLHPHASL